MPLPWKSGSRQRASNSHANHLFSALDHPDLPSSPSPKLHRSTSVSDRISSARISERARDRSSVAILPTNYENSNAVDLGVPGQQNSPLPSPGLSSFPSPSFPSSGQQSPSFPPQGALNRGQSASGRDEALGSLRTSPVVRQQHQQQQQHQGGPSAQHWTPDLAQLPSPTEQQGFFIEAVPTMTGRAASTASKGSTDSASSGLDAWSKRRLNRLNTEQGFREQRQGGPSILSPPPPSEAMGYSNALGVQYTSDAQPHLSSQQSQPQNPSYPGSMRTGQQPAAPSLQSYPVSNSRSGSISVAQELPSSTQPLQTYSPPDSSAVHNNLPDSSRPQQGRTQSNAGVEDASMSASKIGNPAAPQPLRTGNRQSVHNGIAPRDGSALAPAAATGQQQQQGVSSFSSSVVPPAAQGGPYKGDANAQGDARKTTPQPQTGDDMTEEDVNQLIKDHKELREKYTKVKKYYFEKEDQVKQLQNSLAHQRLSQSRTSLDDTEYSTRFNRLDGLIAQLAFSIRKSWKSLPSWLVASVNKDAVQIGKQEMTAAGKAFVSCWLSEEVFEKFFHPDLDLQLSQQLKMVQKNIRRFSPPCITSEEEDFLTAKVVNWRLSTLEGLAEVLRSPQCSNNRAQLTDMLKEHLIGALSVHLQDPPTSDLEGGVHMIIELVVSIASHLPVESREVVIEYYMPGAGIISDHMKVETGIPPLTVSIAEDAADRASMKSSTSDVADLTPDANSNEHSHPPGKKRSMLSALTGTGKAKGVSSAAKAAGAGGSSSSLNRPESQSGLKEDRPPSVRMAAGLGVTVRGRTVLVKAPIFTVQ